MGCSADEPPQVTAAEPSPLAHLTPEQYANTLRDLFPGVDMPEVELPAQLEGAGGFENNAVFMQPTAPFIEAYARTALEASEALSLEALGLDCDASSAACIHPALLELAERVWRRPLRESEASALLADYDQWAASYGPQVAMQLSVQLLLQAPDFLYLLAEPTPSGELDGWALASRLSYFLWDTMPDAELFGLARDGEIGQAQTLEQQARRMLDDPRARQALANLHRQLFDFDELSTIDLGYYAEALDGASPTDYYVHYLQQVRYEPEVFVIQHVFEGEGRLSSLLSSNRAWITPDTARAVYGVEIPADAPSLTYATPLPVLYEQPERTFYEVELDPSRRAGLFTLANFLSAKAGPRQPSPVERGLLVLERLGCRELHVPDDVPPLSAVEQQAPRTNRERFAMHTEMASCRGCHQQIDGLGFPFEHYDALGAWRELDNGYPVDASGELIGTDVDGEVEDAVEMLQRLADSRSVHDCYARQVYRYAIARPEDEQDAEPLAALQDSFWASEGDIQQLLVDIVLSAPFRGEVLR